MAKNDSKIYYFIQFEWRNFFLRKDIRRLRNNSIVNAEKLIVCYLEMLGLAAENNYRILDHGEDSDFADTLSLSLIDSPPELVKKTLEYFIEYGIIIKETIDGLPAIFFPEAEKMTQTKTSGAIRLKSYRNKKQITQEKNIFNGANKPQITQVQSYPKCSPFVPIYYNNNNSDSNIDSNNNEEDAKENAFPHKLNHESIDIRQKIDFLRRQGIVEPTLTELVDYVRKCSFTQLTSLSIQAKSKKNPQGWLIEAVRRGYYNSANDSSINANEPKLHFNPTCQECHGSGWKFIVRENGSKAVTRCTCGKLASAPFQLKLVES